MCVCVFAWEKERDDDERRAKERTKKHTLVGSRSFSSRSHFTAARSSSLKGAEDEKEQEEEDAHDMARKKKHA